MNLEDNLQFKDEARVALEPIGGFEIEYSCIEEVPEVEVNLADKVRQRVADSPLDKILNDLNVQDPYADIGK